MKTPSFQKDSIRAILENPFYTGLIARYPRPEFDMLDDIEHPENIPAPSTPGNVRNILELHPGQHEALIPMTVWQAVHNLRTQKAKNPTNSTNKNRIYILSGVGRCWECFSATGLEYTLRGSTGGKGTAYYRCAYLHDAAIYRKQRKQPRTSGLGMIALEPDTTLVKCHASLRADKLEPQVDEIIARLHIPDDWQEHILAYYLTDDGMTEFERESYNLRQSLKRHKEMHLDGHISKAEYEHQARFIAQRLNSLKPSARPEAQEILPFLKSFPKTWQQFTNGEKRALLGTFFAGLFFDRDGNLRHTLAYEPFGEMLGLS